MKIICGIVAIYLWIGILFALANLIILRTTSNRSDYKVICQHPALLVLRWPHLLYILILTYKAYKKLQYFKKVFEQNNAKTKQIEKERKENYVNIVYDKSKNINDRLNALVELGAVDYLYDEENK